MSQFLIIHRDELYIVEDVETYDEALDFVSQENDIPRDELILECPDLETERRQLEQGLIQ